MNSKTSRLTSDLTSMYACGYGAARRFTNTRVPHRCGRSARDRHCGGEVPGDRQDGAVAGSTSEEIAVGRRTPGAAAAALTLCCALGACGGDQGEQAMTSPAGSATSASHPSAFPPPPATAAARAAGRVCRGKSAGRVRSAYLDKALAGASRTERRLLTAAAKQRPASVPLAARIYAMTVKKSRRPDAYVACAYVLSLKESSR